MRLPLLGCVLGVLLHRIGLFTLHASAVVIGGHVVAFIGEKGAGKSTIAAALYKKGHPLMVDDIVALKKEEGGQFYALPGFPQCKLWPASASALGENITDLARLHPELEKRALRPEIGVQETALPLSQIYVLSESNEIEVEKLSLKEAFMYVFMHQYAPRFLGKTEEDLRLFQECQMLLQQVPVFKLNRPKEFSQFSEVLEVLEEHVLELSTGPESKALVS